MGLLEIVKNENNDFENDNIQDVEKYFFNIEEFIKKYKTN